MLIDQFRKPIENKLLKQQLEIYEAILEAKDVKKQ